MKKKFVLTLALVLMVAVTLTAATPVEVSGTFDFSYPMAIKDGLTVDAKNGSEYNTFVAVSSDYWKVTLGSGTKLFAKDTGLADAKAEIYLSKALADEGVDMGDLGLTLHVGTKIGLEAASVFANKADWKNFKADTASANLGVAAKYGDLVDLYFATDVKAAEFSGIIGAKSTPVDGVSVALGYGIDKKVFAASVAADVAKLADLDFDLAVTAAYKGDFAAETNDVFADVAGEYEGIGLYVGFQAANLKTYGLRAGVSYGTEIEGVALNASVDLKMDDLKDSDDLKVEFGADASYEMGTVTYKLALGYELKGAFTVTPSVSFSF